MSDDERPLRVIQVTRTAAGGGGEQMASALHRGLLRRGHRSWLVTTRGVEDDPATLTIPARRVNPAQRVLRRGARVVGRQADWLPGALTIQRSLRKASAPVKALRDYQGRDYFDYPGTALIPDLPPEEPDVIHLHNLHGRYFDLRQLAPMSHRAPVVMTLHDEWTMTGHCAYTLGCERWRIGCGSCPDLTIYPAIPRDATRPNLRAKADIYGRSRLYVITPSQWLMDRAQQSVLRNGAAGWRVIPNGTDRSIFRPSDRLAARRQLDLPADAFVLLFVANFARRNMFKDHATVLDAAVRAARVASRRVVCIALGDTGEPRSFENGEFRFEPFRSDLHEVAAFFQAADLYLHAAFGENFPTTVLEALATGLPVVATAVGGIPEQVRSLAGAPGGWTGTTHDPSTATGVLVPQADPVAMGSATAALLEDASLRRSLGANAAADAERRFDAELQLDTTIGWYREIIADWETAR